MVERLSACACVVVGVGIGIGLASVPASQPASRPTRPTDAQIRDMVRQLSHPVHARRRAAVRQLAEWGPVAFPELRRVAKSGDMETALSARDLLRELESAILIGAHVRLEVDRPRIAWNEACAVTVHASNPTEEKIEVPWPAEGGQASQPAETQPEEGEGDALAPATPTPLKPPLSKGGKEDGGPQQRESDSQHRDGEPRQVAAMMDAGDFLVVTGPDGQQVDLRVEPIERDPNVYAEVNLRARGKPPSHPMPAGASDRLVIPSFNHGWARFPMLKAGRYTIAFCYQPQWNDSSWTDDKFGLVRSEPVTVEITEAAPEAIRTADVPLRLQVRRDGDSFVAELESTWDHELWVNLNIGDNLQTHARLEWRLGAQDHGETKEGDGDDERIQWLPDATGEAFRLERVHVIRPGKRLVIGKAPVAALREQLSKASKPPAAVEVSAKYLNLANAPQIRESTADKGKALDAPTHLFSGTVISEAVPLGE